MVKKLAVIIFVCGLVASACAEGEPMSSEGDETTTTASSATSTTLASSTTSGEPTTTTTTPPTAVVDSAFDELARRVTNAPDLTSGRMDVTVSISGLEADATDLTEVSFGFSTAFDTEANVSSFVMDLASLADAMPTDEPGAEFMDAFAGTMEMRQIGDVAYVKMPFFTELLGIDTPWISMPADQGEGFTSDFSTVPSDPTEVMTAYEGADVTVEDLGSETVNGVETTHYRLTFDTTTWLDELTPGERSELEESGLLAEGVLPMEIWVAAEGHVVRLLLELDGSTLDLPPGEGFASMTMRYELSQIGQPVTVTAPPASEVTPVDELGFGDFDLGLDS